MLVDGVMPALLSVSVTLTPVRMSEQLSTLQHRLGDIPPLKNESFLNPLWPFHVFSLIFNILGFWSWIMFMCNYCHNATRSWVVGMVQHRKAGPWVHLGRVLSRSITFAQDSFPYRWHFLSDFICSSPSCLKVKFKSHLLQEVVLELFSNI